MVLVATVDSVVSGAEADIHSTTITEDSADIPTAAAATTRPDIVDTAASMGRNN